MTLFSNMSLRRQQIFIIMLTTGIALLLACAAFVIYDTVTFRSELAHKITGLARVIGNSCAGALDFDDPKTAQDMLNGLRHHRSIRLAALYNRQGQLFAQPYQRADSVALRPPPEPHPEGGVFHRDEFGISHTIVQDGEVLGTIFVLSDLSELSQRLQRYALIVVLVFVLALLAALMVSHRLERVVSGPISTLARLARTVAREKNYSVRAGGPGGEEIQDLIKGFNEMLVNIQHRDAALQAARDTLELRVSERTKELERQVAARQRAHDDLASAQRRLMDVSRQAGMAEVATGVLHNIGNVLNSVNVSATLVANRIQESRLDKVVAAVQLLRDHQSDLTAFVLDDPKGQRVLPYLDKLVHLLREEEQLLIKELDGLNRNVEHIKGIVSVQQNFAKVSGVTERLSFEALVNEAMQVNQTGLERHGIKVIRDFEPTPEVFGDKHKILQILLNLIRNAKEAIKAAAPPERILYLRVRKSGEERVRIEVQDTGVGVAPEHLTSIFSHGFTTKRDGHGFGLHLGALAARQMGGSLTAASPGPGCGATFILELPLCAAQPEPAFVA